MEGQGADKEQQRQDGLKAPDVEGPPTVEETSTQVSTQLDHTENHTRGENGPPTVSAKSKEIMKNRRPNRGKAYDSAQY